MIQDIVHQKICSQRAKIEEWFDQQKRGLYLPFYCSFDIRDSGFKVAPVDANIYPAGFNNICMTDKDHAPPLIEMYFSQRYPNNPKNIALLTEEHTENAFYWENVKTILDLLTRAGYQVKVTFPQPLEQSIEVVTATGQKVIVESNSIRMRKLFVADMVADLIISNNDFSVINEDWLAGIDTPINPPPELGWHQRRKDQFFSEYNHLAEQFADLIGVDPWLLTVETRSFSNFDIADEANRGKLASEVDNTIAGLKTKYTSRGIETDPYVFVKNSSGTYGLAVIEVKSGDEVRQWNYKSRKKMKAAKGGRDVEDVIIQEGVPSVVRSDGATAEPAIYMIGCQLAGGFLRTHSLKGPTESLNSPGAVYKRLCVSDLKINVQGCPMENVYGWVAKLGVLAIGRETKTKKIQYRGYSLE